MRFASTCGPATSAAARRILRRLRNSTMPCDGAWPQSWTEVFARWAESGFRPRALRKGRCIGEKA